MLQVGQKAPDFKLIDTDKNEVTLEKFHGKNLVLFFFPMAWAGVCTKEMCSIQEDYNTYEGLNTQTVGVSVDTLFALKRFGEDNKIGFPLLSDFNKQAINDYGVVHKDFAFGYKDVSKRATFVLDKDGVIRHIEILPQLGDMPNMDAIKEVLKNLN
ncbi:MAG: redoxin domain-containing protein [Bacteroidota bacterium]